MASVIVFGPTGRVGSVTARTAEALGAKVWLAMRDPSKPIPGLGAEQEKTGGYERVQADLHKPDTLSAAVKTSGAKRAFIYLAHGSSDHMKAALQSLQSAGIEFVVFLSSFTVHSERQEELREIPASDVIPCIHAQVELNLNEIFGSEKYVAVRPGTFITNLLQHKNGINKGEVSFLGTHWETDAITPIDMGQVSGTILVTGSRKGQRIVCLHGPQLIEQGEALKRIGECLGKDIRVNETDATTALNEYAQANVPKPFAEYMVRVASLPKEKARLRRPRYEEGVKNVKLYTGRASTPFGEWIAANKELFSV